ncbi:hypothetical protein LP416_28590 [Polaromonas sp. P2-4]|nr:hypothetical protein LP416_28590 [Polaromonas sp. P2-4]
MKQFENKVVLLTGGGAGIGLAATAGIARQGALVITGRREETLKAAS